MYNINDLLGKSFFLFLEDKQLFWLVLMLNSWWFSECPVQHILNVPYNTIVLRDI